MRVLVVEDEDDLGAVFRDFLMELGHQPIVVPTAEAALGTIDHDRPDAIILDIHLPGMSGLDFMQLRSIRESGLPIVAVSGVATDSQARECLRLGALEFVGKPVPLDRLTEVLTYLEPHALGRHREEALERAERRRCPRAPVDVAVQVTEYRGVACEGRCCELSATGIEARLPVSLARGTAVKLTFTPPDDGEPIDAVALVVREDAGVTALGFVELSAAETSRLRNLVDRLRPV